MVAVQNMTIKNLIFLCLFLISAAYAVDKESEDSPFQLSYQSISFAEWDDVLASYKNNILVVDMWATWCSSCLKRFPHMVELNHKYRDKSVKFISLLLEDPEEPEAIDKAKKFLINQKADFDHYFMNENIMHSFEKLDLLGIPTVFIYSKDGKLTDRLTGDNPNNQFSEKDIEDTINRLLSVK